MNIKRLQKKIEKKADYFKTHFYEVSEWLLKRKFFTSPRISFEDKQSIAELLVELKPEYITTLQKSSDDPKFTSTLLKRKLEDPNFCCHITHRAIYYPGDTYYAGEDDQLEEDESYEIRFFQDYYDLVPEDVASSKEFLKSLFELETSLSRKDTTYYFDSNVKADQTPFDYFSKKYLEESKVAVKEYLEENTSKETRKLAKEALASKNPGLAKELFGKNNSIEDLSK